MTYSDILKSKTPNYLTFCDLFFVMSQMLSDNFPYNKKLEKVAIVTHCSLKAA